MTTYHFCAMSQNKEGNLNYYDGTYNRDKPFETYDEYLTFKQKIKEKMEVDPCVDIAILSLTMIG